MIEKPDFDKAEQRARDLRLYQPDNEQLELDVREMKFDKPIFIESYEGYASKVGCDINDLSIDGVFSDGYTIIAENMYLILYNGDITNQQHLNWTIAHEIGHIYCGHTVDGTKEEIEANWFAAELLAPECVVRCLANKITIGCSALQYLFGISYTAACKRIDSLNRKCMWQTYREKEILIKYNNAMERYIRILSV